LKGDRLISKPELSQFAASGDKLEGKRILIVDDDERNRNALENLLEAENMQVVIAMNGKEAISILNMDKSIDAVLMNIMMPFQEGNETTKLIRESGNFGLPIIALISKAMKGDREQSLEAGFTDYMLKPIDSNTLLEMILKWVKG
jgi:CheY-like chemotaxis protein